MLIGLGNVSSTGFWEVNSSVRPATLVPAQPPSNPTTVRGGAVSKSITATAKPIDRHQLMDAPTALVLNVTVDSPFAGYSAVAGVTLAGVPLQWQSNRSVTGDTHFITLQPPDIGWVGDATSSSYFFDRVLILQVAMACGNAPFLVMTVTVASPGLARDLAAQVKTLAQSTQIASVLVGGSSGAALSRALALRSMALCDASGGSGGVVDLGLTICPTDDSDAAVVARSAIFSNVVIMCVVAALLLLFSALWAIVRNVPLRTAAATFGLPSTLMPICTVVIPSWHMVRHLRQRHRRRRHLR